MGFWTADRDETLLRLKAERLSAAEMAAALGGVTRNAVLGRLHRLGIKDGKVVKKRILKKHKAQVAAYKPPPKKAPSSNWVVKHRMFPTNPVGADVPLKALTELRRRPPRITCTPADEELAANPLNLRLADLDAQSCRWPVNEPPPKGEHLFCGHRKSVGSYCKAHAVRSIGSGTESERSAPRALAKHAA